MDFQLIKEQVNFAQAENEKGSYDEAERLAKEILTAIQAHQLSKVESDLLKAEANLILGSIEWRRGNLPVACDQLTISKNIFEDIKNDAGTARTYTYLGNVYLHQADYNNAIEYYHRALKLEEELGRKQYEAMILGNLGVATQNISNYPMALEYYQRAVELNKELDNKKLTSVFYGNIGILNILLSNSDLAIENLMKAVEISELINDKFHLAVFLGNIGNVHSSIKNHQLALEYYLKAVEISEEVGNGLNAAYNLCSIGSVYVSMNNFDLALDYFYKSLKRFETFGDKNGIALNFSNIGEIYTQQGNYHKAMQYFQNSFQLFKEIGSKANLALNYVKLGAILSNKSFEDCDLEKAENFLLESIKITNEIGNKEFTQHRELAALYKSQKRWEEYAQQIELFYKVEKEIQNEDAKKKTEQIEYQRQVAEREKEIAIAKATAESKYETTTLLLHKVLPKSIAMRMIDGENEIADHFSSVSILFADIENFTPLSAQMPATMVVRLLNYIFNTFDKIMEKYGCEKIKTIGDGYMAVAGAPEPCEDHAERMASAAWEMIQTIHLPEDILKYLPLGTSIGVRIGIHTGAIIGGIIGENRFMYDIYSDAVNTASRMESHGEVNKIHVSQDFVSHIEERNANSKNNKLEFLFQSRGDLFIKGKGNMQTYFLSKI